MAFLARVELHDGSNEDWEKLHKAMETIEFMRISNKTGKALPPGTYLRRGEGRIATMRDALKDAARRIKEATEFSFFIVEFEQSLEYNLQ